MVVKKYILERLTKLDREYNNSLSSPDVNDAVLRCKLATLEYCGWIEETFDLIARRAAKNKIRTQPYLDILNDTIDKTYGFQYKQHLRKMLSKIVGLAKMETIESRLRQSTGFSQFTSELEQMKTYRNNAAHTWVNATTAQYPSPSQIIGSLNKVYPVARSIYSEVSKK